MLDQLGVPRDSKWRSLILYMRSIKDYEFLSFEQRERIQALVLEVMKDRRFTDENFRTITSRLEKLLHEPWNRKIMEMLAETAHLAEESKRLIRTRHGNIEDLRDTTISDLESGKDVTEVVGDLKKRFSEVLAALNNDVAHLEKLSTLDSLTNLANRRMLDAFLNEELPKAAAQGKPFSLLMCDIDFFKRFNDKHGHRIGDQALVAVANIISAMAQEERDRGQTVLASRFGGEEFVLAMPDLSLEEAYGLAEALRQRISAHTFIVRDLRGEVLNEGIHVTVSIGLAEMAPSWAAEAELDPEVQAGSRPASRPLAEKLIDAADLAMYEAKAGGRDRVVLYQATREHSTSRQAF